MQKHKERLITKHDTEQRDITHTFSSTENNMDFFLHVVYFNRINHFLF